MFFIKFRLNFGLELRGKGIGINGKLRLICFWCLIIRYLFNEEKGKDFFCKNVYIRGFFFMINVL